MAMCKRYKDADCAGHQYTQWENEDLPVTPIYYLPIKATIEEEVALPPAPRVLLPMNPRA